MATPRTPGTLTLIGSGELAPSMSRVHRAVVGRIAGEARAVFIDTPAGFEPNVDDIAEKARLYFERHLGLNCAIASFREATAVQGAQAERSARAIRQSNYVFAGPGSPTYAVRNWRGTAVFAAVEERLAEGAEVVMASAAAIAASAHALPVYEIFKAGSPLYWEEGLDLLGPYGLRLAIVPHWNNSEGANLDTRYCYMGRERFERLRALLDPDVVILGLDEYTACQVNLSANWCMVLGAGAVSVLRGGDLHEFGAGEGFSTELLKSARETRRQIPAAYARGNETDLAKVAAAADRASAEGISVRMAAAAFDLATALDAAGSGADRDPVTEARTSLTSLVERWLGSMRDDAHAGGDIGPYVELLLDVRRRLRDERQWALADSIRDGLSELGVTLEDGPSGTAWRTD